MIFFEECDEYHNKLLRSRLNVDESVNNTVEDEMVCPISLSDYIVEGEEAAPKEFPHMVK